MAIQSVLTELETSRRLLWDQNRRRGAAYDVVSQLLGRPHASHEYLTAQLEVAHTHMVGRDMAGRAVMAVLDAPRPRKRDAEEARRLLADVIFEYGWHCGGLERTVALVRDQQEEAAHRARRAAAPPAHPQPALTSVPTARSSTRSLA
jgi:hypothetical protein